YSRELTLDESEKYRFKFMVTMSICEGRNQIYHQNCSKSLRDGSDHMKF
ncbi:6810_t:CDS:1, partial [Funneliformis mosseae]